MQISETALIVGLIAEGDNRKIDKTTIVYWHDLIGDLPFQDTQQAVREHRRTTTEWLMPAHIRRLVASYRSQRIAAAGQIVPDVDPDDPTYFTKLRKLRTAIADGQPTHPQITRQATQ